MAGKADKKRATTDKVEREGLSQEEAAVRVGCSQSTIGRAIRRGDIDLLTTGRIPESEVGKLIELRKQDEREHALTADLQRRLTVAETEKAEAVAKLKAMEVERESGRFVELDHVRKDAADSAERAQSIIRAVPQRTAMALECACRSAAVVEAAISAEVERAITEINKSPHLKDPE